MKDKTICTDCVYSRFRTKDWVCSAPDSKYLSHVTGLYSASCRRVNYGNCPYFKAERVFSLWNFFLDVFWRGWR